MSTLCASINKALQAAPKPGTTELQYGTAGFRTESRVLAHAMVRVGMVAVLRSFCHKGLPTGVCVTASHNPINDNGVKIVEPDGGMLAEAFERVATELVNSDTPFSTLEESVLKICNTTLSKASEDFFRRCRVVVACDTRPSSGTLTELVKLGIASMGAQVIDCGVATTPQLHWTVLTRHQDAQAAERKPEEFHEAYYDHWTQRAREFYYVAATSNVPAMKFLADCACGVGGPAQDHMKKAFEVFGVDVELRNHASSVHLNDECGAEHVQKQRALPRGISPASDAVGQPCISYDGDADRVVFFAVPAAEHANDALTTLVDGDRIAALLAKALCRMLEQLPVCAAAAPLRLGIVQTAYANGASTDFLRNTLSVPTAFVTKEVTIAKTGVKNLHRVAETFDIGVYFESNGHGTIYYKRENILSWLAAANVDVEDTRAKIFLAFLALLNHCVGDAIVDALAVVAAMRYLQMSFDDVLSMYPELNVVQIKVPMTRAKLNLLKSHPAHELFLVQPADLQQRIQAVVAQHPPHLLPRAFVRASGTEDVCRIYAESNDPQVTAAIAHAIHQLLVAFQAD